MTKYIKEENLDNKIILSIANEIVNGKIVVFKTDTVYGVGTNAFLEEACRKIYELKERPIDKPLNMLISDISMLEKIVDFINPTEQKLIDNFWPGALTIKFKKKKDVLPDIISAGDEYVRVRLLNQGLIYNLIKIAGVPVVAPSANLNGSLTGTKIKNIIDELGGKVDYILDSGDLDNNTPTSTIVEIKDDKAIIIREGSIKKKEIEKVVPLYDRNN